MGRFTEHADVATGVQETFAYVTDHAEIANWNDHVRSVEVVGGGPLEVGSTLRQHRRRGKRSFDLTFEVVEHEPPRRHTVVGDVFGTRTTMAFSFEPHGSGTRVTMAADVAGRGFGMIVAPMVTSEMRRSTVAALAALAQRLGSA
jgi:Polyketide cyclase / dehydrase and lipid transport